MSGKASRLFCALMLPILVSTPVMADTISGGDTAWILTSTALVLFMTIPGLSLFYAGLVRVKNVLSVLMQCFALTALMSVLWFVAGYTLAFGSSGVEQGPFIGDLGNLFLAKVSMDSVSGSIPETLFVMFQLTFAVITPALIVGGFAERMRFSAVRFGYSSFMHPSVIGYGAADGSVIWDCRILRGVPSCTSPRVWQRSWRQCP